MGMRESLWDRVFRLAMTGILLLLAVVMMIPLVSVLALSFSSKAASDMNAVNLLPVGFTFDSWRYILFNRDIWRAFFITVAATVSGVVLSLAITSLFAYPLSKKEFKASKLLMIVALITMVFKAPVVPYFLTLKNIGLFNNPLVLVLPQILTAYNMIIMRSFFQQFPKEVEEAAMIDGASRFKVFYQIVLPSSKAVLATVGLFYGVTLWNQFQHPMMFIQDMKLFPLQMKIRQLIGSGSELQNVAASVNVNYSDRTLQAVVVVFAILPIIAVYPFIQKYFTKGAMLGSVKG
ncbi:MAG: carbohydrate ABC transporter permease [Hungatella hathewayi]|nr:carbohydrate ABC transporter permease [Hungatella hathewayi]